MIHDNIISIKAKIAAIAEKCDRDPESVKLVAVSKRFPTQVIREALNTGQTLFGENYIQEAQQKYDEIGDEACFHFIGHLQTNKAKVAAKICSMIETVDRLKLAHELNKHLLKMNKTMDILVQVNIGLDEKKSGTTAEETEELLKSIAKIPTLRVKGLMTMPPFTPEPEDARPFFRQLRLLAISLAEKKLFHDNNSIELSMGMTQDYHIAIEEGATLVRIGTAIFGERQPLNI